MRALGLVLAGVLVLSGCRGTVGGRPATVDAADGWSWIQSADVQATIAEEQERFVVMMAAEGPHWNEQKNVDQLRALVQQNEASLASFKRAADAPTLTVPPLIGQAGANKFVRVSLLGFLVLGKAKLELRAGDAQAAADTAQQVLRVAKRVKETAQSTDVLVLANAWGARTAEWILPRATTDFAKVDLAPLGAELATTEASLEQFSKAVMVQTQMELLTVIQSTEWPPAVVKEGFVPTNIFDSPKVREIWVEALVDHPKPLDEKASEALLLELARLFSEDVKTPGSQFDRYRKRLFEISRPLPMPLITALATDREVGTRSSQVQTIRDRVKGIENPYGQVTAMGVCSVFESNYGRMVDGLERMAVLRAVIGGSAGADAISALTGQPIPTDPTRGVAWLNGPNGRDDKGTGDDQLFRLRSQN